jgi:hypothetical protein
MCEYGEQPAVEMGRTTINALEVELQTFDFGPDCQIGRD